MKITSIRSMRLFGPLIHGVGGETGGMIGKVVVRVDTDAGIYGLGEADDFMGVREAITYMHHYFMGRDPFEANPIISELLWASLPPHPPTARHGTMPGGIVAVPSSSPTAIPLGPVAWAASAVDIALCDLIGKALGVPAYTLLGGKFRDRIRIYLDRSSPPEIEKPESWRAMARAAVDAGFTQAKFDIDFVASDRQADVWNRSLTLDQINRMVERLAIVRDAVGPDFELCVDLHRQYNVPDAIRVANALAPLNLLWLEDPTADTDLDAYVAVRARQPDRALRRRDVHRRAVPAVHRPRRDRHPPSRRPVLRRDARDAAHRRLRRPPSPAPGDARQRRRAGGDRGGPRRGREPQFPGPRVPLHRDAVDQPVRPARRGRRPGRHCSRTATSSCRTRRASASSSTSGSAGACWRPASRCSSSPVWAGRTGRLVDSPRTGEWPNGKAPDSGSGD